MSAKRMRWILGIPLGFFFAVAVIAVLMTTLRNHRLSSAVSDAAWAIKATRYQAIMKGYPHSISFNAGDNTYQVKNQPLGTVNMVNVGNSISLAGNGITISQDTTLEFRPNGIVSAAQGQPSFAIAYGNSKRTIAVSRYGEVTITP